MSKGHYNKEFISDDGMRSFVPAMEKNLSTQNKYVIELKDKKSLKEANYNPYLHRNVQHPTSNLVTLIHLIKGSLGIGILAMPNAFSNSGYIVGVIGTIVIGFLCTYCIHLLIKAEYELCKRKKIPSLDYACVIEAAFNEGPYWCKACSLYIVHIVNIILVFSSMGTCCVYIVFVSTNIKSISDYYTEEETDIKLFMLIILLPLIFINWIRNLKYLAPLSTIANFITLISFGMILYYIFREPISLEGRKAVGEITNFPLFFGTVLFALEAIGIMLPLENEMKTPQSFGGACGVLNISMIFNIFLYICIGLFGYLNYGDEAAGTITLNLPPHEILAQCVKGMLSFTIFVSYSLASYVPIDILWNIYLNKRFTNERHKLIWEYIIRTSFVLIIFFSAVAIPNLELFISLFGSLCLAALGFVFPVMAQTCTFWYQVKGCAKIWMIAKNCIIILAGVFGLIVGTYRSISDIFIIYFPGQNNEHHLNH